MRMLFAGIAGCAAAGLGGAVAAQSDIEAAIEAAIACRSIADDAGRLSCLDAATGGLQSARDKLVAGKTGEKEGMLARFGLSGDDEDDKDEGKGKREVVETVEEFGAEGIYEERHAKLEQKLKEVEAMTTKIVINARKEATLYLDNGQVWRQISADSKTLTVSDKTDPYPVEIKRTAFGNYLATVKGINRTIRVRRIK